MEYYIAITFLLYKIYSLEYKIEKLIDENGEMDSGIINLAYEIGMIKKRLDPE